MNWKKFKNPAFAACVLLLLAAFVSFGVVKSALGAVLVKKRIEAPMKCRAIAEETTNWIKMGEDRIEAEATETTLGTQNYLSRLYVRKDTLKRTDQKPVALEMHLAYYTGMVDTVPHVPERCMVGGGFSLVGEIRKEPLRFDALVTTPDTAVPETFGSVMNVRNIVPGNPRNGQRVHLPSGMDRLTLRVSEFHDPKTKQQMFAGYFFIANGGIATSAEDVRLLAFDLRSDYAYYLKVQLSSPYVTSSRELTDQVQDLLNELLPEILMCVPDWVAVRMGKYPAEAKE